MNAPIETAGRHEESSQFHCGEDVKNTSTSSVTGNGWLRMYCGSEYLGHCVGYC